MFRCNRPFQVVRAFVIARTRGLTRHQVASDFGIGLSTPGNGVRAGFEETKVPAQDAKLLRQNKRLGKKNRILQDEQEVSKEKAKTFCAARKSWNFGILPGIAGSLPAAISAV